MKYIFLLAICFISVRCTKDTFCDECGVHLINTAPIARAGLDQTILLPLDSVTLNGNSSFDMEGNITSYQWTKVSGPVSYSFINAHAPITVVKNLVQGSYRFELTVTDTGNLSSRDTVQINVLDPLVTVVACDGSVRPVINAQLIEIGTLSQPRIGKAVASAGSKILFAGGGESSAGFMQPSSRVDIYDTITQTWSTAELCRGRFEIAATAAGNKIFFAGGESSDGTWPVDSVDIYDVLSNTWSVSHLSSPGNSMVAASVGNKVLFAGGDPGSTGGATSRASTVDIFDMSTNTWTTAPLTEAKYGMAAVTLNNKVYFGGGFKFISTSDKVEIFDNTTGTWTTELMQESRSHHGGIAANGKIFWAGSASDEGCTVEMNDPVNGSQSMEYLSKPNSWNFSAGQHIALKNNKLVFLRAGFTATDKFDIYDLATHQWTVGQLPQPLPFGSSFFSVNNTVYVAGGNIGYVWRLEF